ncbi:pirin domain-containing protein [Leucosporidium creatinivorum]|uniref:Pirin domain-containing protein n=1 Tax=Leucosporidium creatinivorum TaxID=106004 RepID=A0A1Y2G1J9_9BASI|nr:pirin domain-containing protein [Leucosporidium creatinivorum]
MAEAVKEAVKSALKIVPRRSAARGHANHGWLKSYHSFSFANYQDPNFNQWGSLRVINEDRVEPGEGFGQHSHREFEIWSYIISGELEHRDSLGNLEIMKPGEIQMTSTGTGISHSEYNRHASKQVHFLQIWGLPSTRGLKPSYYNRHFSREDKLNKLVTVVAPLGAEGVLDERNTSGPAPVHAPLSMHASILESKQSVKHTLAEKTTKAYLHLIMKSGYRSPNQAAGDKYEDGGAMLKVNGGLILEEGDGAFVEVKTKEGSREIEVVNVAEREAEWLLFEME